MKTKFSIKGLDCPNCAAKLEGMLARLDGIDSAKINFLTEKITVESTLDGDALLEAVSATALSDLLDEKLLMTLASVGAFLLGEYTEGIAVLLFFTVGEYFEHRAVRASRRSIAALMDICPDRATVLRDGEAVTVDADEVEIGETLLISPGERIALDCEVCSGEASVDVAAITGESLPISARVGVHLASGSLCLDGRLVAKCEATAECSAAARILSLVEQAQESKSREESFITKFSRVYTPTVVALAALLGGVLPLLLYFVSGGPIEGLWILYRTWVHRALIFLVVSCPCALVISVPLSFFGGIGGAASVGILFKGGNRFHAVARVKTVCFDKTGTLTAGECRLLSLETFGKLHADEILSLAASASCFSVFILVASSSPRIFSSFLFSLPTSSPALVTIALGSPSFSEMAKAFDLPGVPIMSL